MRYVKIRAKNYNEAMMKLKSEHGDDAIPISHKYVKEGGFLNSKILAREVVELTAGVQDKKPGPRARTGGRNIDFTVGDTKKESATALLRTMMQANQQAAPRREDTVESINRTIDVLNDNLNGIKAESSLRKTAPDMEAASSTSRDEMPAAAPVKTLPERMPQAGFEKEFNELKETLNRLVQNSSRDGEKKSSREKDEAPLVNRYMDMLRKNDFDNEECRSIIREMKNSISNDDLNDEYKIEKSLKDLLKSRIVTAGPIKVGNKKKIIMFIGPTGVGKTTTMAKLGALYSLREGNRVVFITIDNYRIAATEQLKKYAEIMRIPIYAVNDQKEFKSIINREKAEIILVDTSGRSHRNQLKISEIKSFADGVEFDFEKVLCVSANTRKSDLNEVFKAFDMVNFDSVIITKVDESSNIGNVVDIADKYHKPISYFTNGQEVPNDIEVADSDRIVDMMIGDINS
jgi:flagellar biosynthesis protein FlhF